MNFYKVFICVSIILSSITSATPSKAQCGMFSNNFCTVLFGFDPNENIVNLNQPHIIIATADQNGSATICPEDPALTAVSGTGSGCVAFKVMPVTLIDFTAKNNNDQSVLLQWSTADEKNNIGFEIERSSDAVNYDSIGFVPATKAATAINYYSYKDEVVNNGRNYYRLKQIDEDGTYTYSHLTVIQNTISTKKIHVSPNPVSDILHIHGDDMSAPSLVYNSTGTLLLSTYTNQLDVSSLQPGLYFLKNNSESAIFIKE